jgi:hypothetical protein
MTPTKPKPIKAWAVFDPVGDIEMSTIADNEFRCDRQFHHQAHLDCPHDEPPGMTIWEARKRSEEARAQRKKERG